MAASSLNAALLTCLRRAAGTLPLGLGCRGCQRARCRADGAHLPIDVDANSEFDYDDNTLLFHNVRISQGTCASEPKKPRRRASISTNSRWEFSGDVQIKASAAT